MIAFHIRTHTTVGLLQPNALTHLGTHYSIMAVFCVINWKPVSHRIWWPGSPCWPCHNHHIWHLTGFSYCKLVFLEMKIHLKVILVDLMLYDWGNLWHEQLKIDITCTIVSTAGIITLKYMFLISVTVNTGDGDSSDDDDKVYLIALGHDYGLYEYM